MDSLALRCPAEQMFNRQIHLPVLPPACLLQDARETGGAPSPSLGRGGGLEPYTHRGSAGTSAPCRGSGIRASRTTPSLCFLTQRGKQVNGRMN